jgi:hypothetical protein
MDKQYERLARLVGEALARRWMQVLAKKRPREPRSPRRRRRKRSPRQPPLDQDQ